MLLNILQHRAAHSMKMTLSIDSFYDFQQVTESVFLNKTKNPSSFVQEPRDTNSADSPRDRTIGPCLTLLCVTRSQ